MPGHAESEGSFANAGTCGDDDHFPAFEAGGQLVEFIKAGGDSAVATLAFDEAFDHLDGLGGDLGGADNALRFSTTADFKDVAFGLVENGLNLVRAFMGADYNLGTGLLEFPQEAFIPNLGDVGGCGEDADDPGGEFADQGRPPGGIGKFAVGQPSEKGGGVDGLAGFAHLDDAAENDLVGGVKKVLFPEPFFPRQIHDVLGVGQHGAEQGAFGLQAVMGRKSFDRDGRGGSAASLSTRMGFSNHRNESSVMERRSQ